MGLFDKIRGEFIDIIEWLSDDPDVMVWRFPRYQSSIKMGAKLTVRESQVAVFLNEGQIADVFTPGMWTLDTANLPVMSTLQGWKYGFQSPFKADVFFVSSKLFNDRKWGTKNPIMMRDKEFGAVRVRAFGSYSIRVSDPVVFIKEIAGTKGEFTTEGITDQLRNMILTRFTDALAETGIPVLDLAANYNEISSALTEKIAPEFKVYGLNLEKFLIENISLPPEVEAVLDKRTSMGIIGNLDNFAKYQAANSIEKAAENQGGGASAGLGMGMGMAMANMFGQNMAQNVNQAPSAPPPIPQSEQYFIAVNGQQTGPYDMAALRSMAQNKTFAPDSLVWKNGLANWLKASDLPELSSLFASVPPPVPPPSNT